MKTMAIALALESSKRGDGAYSDVIHDPKLTNCTVLLVNSAIQWFRNEVVSQSEGVVGRDKPASSSRPLCSLDFLSLLNGHSNVSNGDTKADVPSSLSAASRSQRINIEMQQCQVVSNALCHPTSSISRASALGPSSQAREEPFFVQSGYILRPEYPKAVKHRALGQNDDAKTIREVSEQCSAAQKRRWEWEALERVSGSSRLTRSALRLNGNGNDKNLLR
ncbi:hypothetical protein C8F01DRAFT_1371332 [Mycena amicta]|nr:hypothetical protein C8F01DRAFT_1371332 [Mycena amicta]